MTTDETYTRAYTPASIRCLVCGEALLVRPARGRKSGKPFLMLVCGRDGRHFRAFVNDQEYVRGVLERLEGQTQSCELVDDLGHESDTSRRSKTKLERGRGT